MLLHPSVPAALKAALTVGHGGVFKDPRYWRRLCRNSSDGSDRRSGCSLARPSSLNDLSCGFSYLYSVRFVSKPFRSPSISDEKLKNLAVVNG